jgi:hypothetical protein
VAASSVFPVQGRLPGRPFLFSHPPTRRIVSSPTPLFVIRARGDLTALRGTWSLINNFTANHAGVGVAHDWSVVGLGKRAHSARRTIFPRRCASPPLGCPPPIRKGGHKAHGKPEVAVGAARSAA